MAKILIVDDEAMICDLLSRSLSIEGFAVETASNGLVGLEKCAGIKFDLVISDILMPEMDGITMMEKIKDAQPHLPIILITGYAKQYTARKATEAGASDFLTKPFRNAEILQSVRKALKISEPA
jgi:DNA-binding NtrC family response regulator